MRLTFCHIGRFATVLALTLALVVTGFAHRAAARPLTPELTAYVAAGGSLADLCGVDQEDASSATPCPACHLIGATLIPDSTLDLLLVLRGPIRQPHPAPQQHSHLRPADRARHSRAPPHA